MPGKGTLREMVGAMHRARPGRNSRRKPMWGRGCGFAESQARRVRVEAPLCEEMRGRGEGLGQASGVVPQGQLAELGLDRKKICYDIARQRRARADTSERQITVKEKVMQGKPYAGNPHVRFDEGAGAPRPSGRPALLYKKQVVAAMVAAVAFAAAAMPTEEEFAKASKEVQAGLKTQMALWQKGDISNSDLAALMLVQADKFKDEARRYACLQAAFAASVRAGDVAVAAKALKRIESEVSGFSAGHEKQVINKALAKTGKKASEEFRRQLESRLAETGRSAAEIDMIERMKRIEMPVLDFKPPKTLPEVVAYLRQQSIEHGDPTQPEDKRGLSFILKGNLAGRAMPKIHARNISLYNALDLVCQVADCSFSFSEAGGKVAVVIESTRAEDLASGKNPHDIVAFRPPIPRTNAEIGLVGRMKRILAAC